MATYKINIPEACSESWEAMKPTSCGAFCASCQKEVIDFTHKSPAEIARILNSNIGKTTCGKFTAEQTQFEYEYAKVFSPNAWFKRGLVGAFLSLLVSAFTAQAQTSYEKPLIEMADVTEDGKVLFSGCLVDESTNLPVSNVSISLAANTQQHTRTDDMGNFTFYVDHRYQIDTLFIFYKSGFDMQEIKLLPGDNGDVRIRFVKPPPLTITVVETIPIRGNFVGTVGAISIPEQIKPKKKTRE